jgi:hypothetical protein
MTTLTTQQKRVLNSIKFFQAEYQGRVPYNVLKLDLGIHEEDILKILGYLEEVNYISRQDGFILLKENTERDQKDEDVPEDAQLTEAKETLKGADEDKISNSSVEGTVDAVNNVDTGDASDMVDNTVDIGEIERKDQLSETEQKSLEILEKLADDSGNISRTLLEGNLLYGELELSSILMYNLVTSLENKGILKKIKLTDGEYYKFAP